MESKFHILDEINFLPSVLAIKLSSLHNGEPNGYIGLPLTVTKDSSQYLIKFEQVGRYRVICEAFNEFTEPYEKITNFLYRMIDSKYLEENRDTANIFAHGVPPNAQIEHYVVYSEFYVVDILAAKPPTVKVLDRARTRSTGGLA